MVLIATNWFIVTLRGGVRCAERYQETTINDGKLATFLDFLSGNSMIVLLVSSSSNIYKYWDVHQTDFGSNWLILGDGKLVIVTMAIARGYSNRYHHYDLIVCSYSYQANRRLVNHGRSIALIWSFMVGNSH